MLVLSRADVVALLPMTTALDVVARATADYSRGGAVVPQRMHIETESPAGEVLVMPGYLPGLGAVGVKIWSRFEEAAQPGGFATSAVLYYQDPASGIEAFLDASYLTEVRTGAMTGVACRHLARPGAYRLGLIGTGVQARSQLTGVLAATTVEQVRVWDVSPERLGRFLDEARATHPATCIYAATDAEDAVTGADIVATATTATFPVFDDAWISRGALVCGIGSHTPDAAEIDPRTVARAARIVVDTRAGALSGAADISGPIARGLILVEAVAELGELVLGRAPGRGAPDEIAVFKSVGFAALDVVAAHAVVRAALGQSVGHEIQIR